METLAVAGLIALATLPAHPESVPINCLMPMPGTPLDSELLAVVANLARRNKP